MDHNGLRVALVGPSFPPQIGGMEEYLEHLADGLAALGCEVEVFVQRRPHLDEVVQRIEVRDSGVRVRWFPSWTHSRRFPFAPSLAKYLACNRRAFDIVHGHSYHAVPAVMAAASSQAPFIFSPFFHGTGHSRAANVLHKLYRPIGRYAFQSAGSVVAVSRQEASLVRRHFPAVNGRIVVLHAGVDLVGIAMARPFQTELPVVLVTGRLEEYKQVDLAVRAIATIGMRARLVIVGEGPVAGDLATEADRLGVSGRVELLGRVDRNELRRWQKTASVVLCLSRHESFGMSLLEGIAAGARIVASDIPAAREVAEYGPGRVLFVDAKSEAGGVAGAIERQLRAGRVDSRMEGLPTWERLSAGILDVYRGALRNQARTNASFLHSPPRAG